MTLKRLDTTFGLSAPAELTKEVTSWTSGWLASHRRLKVVTFAQEKTEASSCKSRSLKFIPDNWPSARSPNQLGMFVQRKRVTQRESAKVYLGTDFQLAHTSFQHSALFQRENHWGIREENNRKKKTLQTYFAQSSASKQAVRGLPGNLLSRAN